MSGRQGLEFAITSVLLAALAVLATIALDRRDVRVDVTSNQRRTLAPQTIQVLQTLERPIEIVSFYADRPEEQQRFAELVEMYREVEPSIRLRQVDPDRRPDVAEEYGVTANGTVVLEDGDLRLRMIHPGEAQLTAGLVRIASGERPLALFVTGHGETSIEDESSAGWSQAAALLAQQNFEIRLLATDAVRRIPPETSLLVLAGPEAEYDTEELNAITAYLLRGGRVLAMLEPYGAASVDSLVAEFGVDAAPGLIVDVTAEQRNLTRDGDGRIALALGGNPNHPITRNFTFSTLFPIARDLSTVQPPPPGVTATRLLETGERSWSERGRPEDQVDGLVYDEAVDRAGPLGLAYAVDVDLRKFRFGSAERSATNEGLFEMLGDAIDVRDSTRADTVTVGGVDIPRAPAERARLVVIGDTDFGSNANLRVQGNAQLLLASALWLAEQEGRIALPARSDVNDPVVLEDPAPQVIRVVALGAVPLVFFAVGGWMLWRRRQWV